MKRNADPIGGTSVKIHPLAGAENQGLAAIARTGGGVMKLGLVLLYSRKIVNS
jgi:hypothetical protein